eukprot:CAMPEP_0182907226 /NCGR_PEP_ID=MMETSP0034_2-20130328/34338_1 /TAXON_ID=156128 /ORGANISM="Nephroselmis pyriformis, Strain CCMP717" /LENGTH=39 /DNA_ID= /DNA_START= /DNA_END= /DNA_ORIENTATION=
MGAQMAGARRLEMSGARRMKCVMGTGGSCDRYLCIREIP